MQWRDPATLAVLLVAGTAVLTDVRSRRVPNWLTFGAALAALGYHGVIGGASGVGSGLLGWLLGAALFFPVFALGGMGAGDVKLLAALGAWLGPRAVTWVALFSAMAGGVLAVLVVTAHGYWGPALRNLRLLLTHWAVGGVRPLPELTLERGDGIRLAYAVPIGVGTVATLWWRS